MNFHLLFCNFTFQKSGKVSKPQPNKSALHEKEGVSPPETVHLESVKTIQNYRRKVFTTDEYVQGILKQEITALSRAITLVESTNPEHAHKAHEVINACLPHANKSVRIGIDRSFALALLALGSILIFKTFVATLTYFNIELLSVFIG